MERFSRTILGYHGCVRSFAHRILLGELAISEWQPSVNAWDWLGRGIYFWEHSPERALRWASERHGQEASVVGAVIQLGDCFDLLNEAITLNLATNYLELEKMFLDLGQTLPQNRGWEGKRRELDCLILNDTLNRCDSEGKSYDTVRAAFLEGAPVYPTAAFSLETHIQIAVRNPAAILGVFRPMGVT